MSNLISKKNILPAVCMMLGMVCMLEALRMVHDLEGANPTLTLLELRESLKGIVVISLVLVLCIIYSTIANDKAEPAAQCQAQYLACQAQLLTLAQDTAKSLTKDIMKDSIKGVMHVDNGKLKLSVSIKENSPNILGGLINILIYYPKCNNIKIIHSVRINGGLSKVGGSDSYEAYLSFAPYSHSLFSCLSLGSTQVTSCSLEDFMGNCQSSDKFNITIHSDDNIREMLKIPTSIDPIIQKEVTRQLSKNPIVQSIVPSMQLQLN